MAWFEIIGLIALVLVTSGVASWLFQWLKQWVPSNDALRLFLVWVLCIILGLAESWLAGDVIGFIGSWKAGTLTAADVFAYGSVIWGLATGWYNLYWKPKAVNS